MIEISEYENSFVSNKIKQIKIKSPAKSRAIYLDKIFWI